MEDREDKQNRKLATDNAERYKSYKGDKVGFLDLGFWIDWDTGFGYYMV